MAPTSADAVERPGLGARDCNPCADDHEGNRDERSAVRQPDLTRTKLHSPIEQRDECPENEDHTRADCDRGIGVTQDSTDADPGSHRVVDVEQGSSCNEHRNADDDEGESGAESSWNDE